MKIIHYQSLNKKGIILIALHRYFTGLFFVLIFQIGNSNPIELNLKQSQSPPPRIIRTCCVFGSNLHVLSIEKINLSDITSVEKIGPHKYLGSDKEGNGIFYTRRGGFIDLGHLRDQADWTAFLYSAILIHKSKGFMNLNLGLEGGRKKIEVKWNPTIDSIDVIRLAGKIAYDLSVWHEISTWFGSSYIPLVPERYSSFSVEDIYSNLLGVTLGIEALKSKMPFEAAMTKLLKERLIELDAVSTEQETIDALEATKNIWWTNNRSLPSKHILIKRQCEAYPGASPWLIPSTPQNIIPHKLSLETHTSNGETLNDLYEFEIRLNLKLSEKKTMKQFNKKVITQNDFIPLLQAIQLDIERKSGP